MSFIGKLADDTIHKTIIRTFPKQKPWVDKSILDALRFRSAANNMGLDSGNMEEYKAASYSMCRVVKEARVTISTEWLWESVAGTHGLQNTIFQIGECERFSSR